MRNLPSRWFIFGNYSHEETAVSPLCVHASQDMKTPISMAKVFN